jgi:hypothetical protein
MTAEQFGKRVLAANAFFCAACGFALIILPGVLTELMFNTSGSWLFTGALALGAGLVATAAVLLWAGRDTARLAQRLYLFAALDAAWVLASAVILLEFVGGLHSNRLVHRCRYRTDRCGFCCGRVSGGAQTLNTGASLPTRRCMTLH